MASGTEDLDARVHELLRSLPDWAVPVMEQAGRRVSERMAAELGRRQAHVEVSHDIADGMEDLGIVIGPSHEVMHERRYGPSPIL